MNEENRQITTIYEKYYYDIYHFILYFSGNMNDAEDLTQEVFMRLLKSMEKFEGRSNLKTWLFSIAKHVVIDYSRRRKIARLFSVRWLDNGRSYEQSPENYLECKENEKALIKEILQLKQLYRMVIILRGIKDYSVKETAEILGCSESQVKVTFHRAIKKLQKQMRNEMIGGAYSELVER